MRSLVLGLRDVVVCGICAGALVALVLNHLWIGLALGALGVWQVVRVFRGRPSIIGIDQRWSDREGPANLKK